MVLEIRAEEAFADRTRNNSRDRLDEEWDRGVFDVFFNHFSHEGYQS